MATSGCASTASQRVNPEASEKHYLLGASYFEQRMFRPALEELLRSVQLNPENPEAHYLMGLLALQQASEAESMIERQACLAGDDAKLERREVDDHFRKAEAEFKRTVEIHPDSPEAWNSLAVTALHFQRWEDAISAADKALANPIYRQPWAAQGNLGWAYFQKHEVLKAAKELRTALFANPQFCVGRYRLAKVYFEQQNLEAAWEELERVTSDPACPIQEAFLLAGMTALRRSDRTRAGEIFRKCVALAPKSCVARQCRIAE